MPRTSWFDAVLVISFGGPQGLDDIRPFLANVLRGRPVSPQRIEEVVRHYELFGGVSPLTEITARQAALLEERLQDRRLPVYVGMRNWDPLLADTLWTMSEAGVHRAVGFIAAAHRSYSSCLQYRENVADAQRRVRERGRTPPEIIYVSDWHTHPGFIEANATHVEAALAALPAEHRATARLIFTAHSLPARMPGVDRYQQQLRESARLVAERLGRDDWTLVYQSRSGRPQDPWLGPGVLDHLRDAPARGVEAVVLSPIGFLCDHIEILYDLDREAVDLCRELGLRVARAATVNANPRFIDTMADAVTATLDRYRGRPLVLVASEPAPTRRPR